MKNYIAILEKIGQTKSMQQVDNVSQIYADVDCTDQVFKKITQQNQDLICLLLPDDDDEE